MPLPSPKINAQIIDLLIEQSEQIFILEKEHLKLKCDVTLMFPEELANITFLDALKRIMQLTTAMIRKVHNLSEMVISSIIDLIMGEVIVYFGLNNNQTPN